MDTLRLDKWLWSARFFKTRQIAVTAIKSGKIIVNGSRSKPSRMVCAGDELVIDKKGTVFVVEIKALSAQRLSAPLAHELYLETPASIEKRHHQMQLRKLERLSGIRTPKTKPDKRSRREWANFKRGQIDS